MSETAAPCVWCRQDGCTPGNSIDCPCPHHGEKEPLVETDANLSDAERFDALVTIHVPSYLAGWNDAKAGRQYGEGRGAAHFASSTERDK